MSTKRERDSEPALDAKRPRLEPPAAALDAVRQQLQRTADPHLQARLLLRFSAAATAPEARTAAAIDFLFSFLQQNQAQTEADGASGGGAIVVGAIVRGLRQLLAAKQAVVEPMIQVDAMGEQLMQCMSVGEDFKLRRDMLRIVVDCLLLANKLEQLETLLDACVRDHDVGMQAVCLRGYLRLHGVGRRFAEEQEAAAHFDRLAAFVLFSQSEEIRVLAAQVLVVLAELHPQTEIADRFFPSSELLLPEKAFSVLCMAGSDPSERVRVEIARCLRGFSRVLLGEVVEHAVVKTQIDEAVADVAPEVVEMHTRRMVSSGVLLSLLEDNDVEVAAEASRTIARLAEMAMHKDAETGKWSQRALERTITAHFDLLPRAATPDTSTFCRVLVESLQRLLVCRNKLDVKTPLVVSNAELNWLVRYALSSPEDTKRSTVGVLLVLQHCDLPSSRAVLRLVDFLFEAVSSPSFDYFSTGQEVDYWDQKLLDAARVIGKQCAKVVQSDVTVRDRLQQEASRQHNSQHHLLPSLCRALLVQAELPSNGNSTSSKAGPSSLFFLKAPTTQDFHGSKTAVSATMDVLKAPPASGDFTTYLKAIQRLCAIDSKEKLDVAFRATEVLVRLGQLVQSFPDASVVPPPTSHSYVSMEAMLSTSPSVSSTHTGNAGDTKAQEEAAQEFASLHLSAELQTSCQEMLDLARSVYVKAFALSAAPRNELLQLILLARMGTVLGSLQGSTDSLVITDTLRWIVQEATRLRFLFSDSQDQAAIWFPSELLSDINSLNGLKRAFVAVVRKAWPAALVKAGVTNSTLTGDNGAQRSLQALAHASILEPAIKASAKSEPREITANWPFKQRVRFTLSHVRDVTQVFVKSTLPNGDVEYHHVPTSSIRTRGPRKQAGDHSITLTVSPFSDPTTFSMSVCLGHPTLPGSLKPSTTPGEASSLVFVEISDAVHVPIFHRTSSTLRPPTRL